MRLANQLNSHKLLISCQATAFSAALIATSLVFGTPAFSLPPIKATPVKPADKPADKAATAKPTPEPVIENVQNVTSEQLVDKPHEYLNRNIKFVATFYGFNNLALDYKPALRPSKSYLSFLVLRDNSKVPLSELKLAMPIPKEKDPENTMLAQLKDGDQLEITGKVFAAALDEPCVDVLRMKKLKSAPEEKKVAEEKDSKDKKSDEKEPETKK